MIEEAAASDHLRKLTEPGKCLSLLAVLYASMQGPKTWGKSKIKTAIEKGVRATLLINNRAAANTILVAEEIARRFLGNIENLQLLTK
jgi:hypothetical protein